VAELTPRILAGRYEVGELIGRGGMAEVYVGRDTRLGRTIAIKLLRWDLARDPSFQSRFRREAQAAASLNHPAIVSVYDTGEDQALDAQGVPHRVPFIIMEYVEGHTLRELMRDDTALPIDEAADITIGVLSALQYAHHAGIVHRDIKPGNIMLTVTGQVKVMDFGIARALAETSDAVTQTQAVIGTAQYLSPEQARGENVDARSDLYSTGCVLFELLTGRPPFVGDSAVSIAYQHVREYPIPPSALAPDIPSALDQIVIKALAKNRDQRYSTASEFLADLQAFKRGGQISAPRVEARADDPTQIIAPMAVPLAAAPALLYPPAPAAVAAPIVPASTAAPTATVAQPATASFENAGILPPPEDADEAQGSPKRNRLIAIWIAVGVFVLLAILTIILMLSSSADNDPGTTTSTPPRVTVPLVPDSRTVDDAIAAIKDANLVPVEGGHEISDTVAKGLVTRFDPKPGDRVDQGSQVRFYISLGEGSVTIPDLEGKTQEQARQLLIELDLRVATATKTVNSATVPVDYVVGTEPARDDAVPAGTEVTLLVSNGKTAVPDCTGKTQVECSAALLQAGLVMAQVTAEESDSPADTVIRLEPTTNTLVNQKDPIKVIVAKPFENQEVPDVDGMSEADAVAELQRYGFTVKVERDPSYPLGEVFRTEPAGGETARKGSQVVLRVGSGAPATPTP
jgi:serine/threonine-protein kinase